LEDRLLLLLLSFGLITLAYCWSCIRVGTCKAIWKIAGIEISVSDVIHGDFLAVAAASSSSLPWFGVVDLSIVVVGLERNLKRQDFLLISNNLKIEIPSFLLPCSLSRCLFRWPDFVARKKLTMNYR
jgi:hypothetical protein